MGFTPLTLRVTDLDLAPNNGPFRYEILSGDPDNHFVVNHDGRLMAMGTFDMAAQKEFILKVKSYQTFVLGCPPSVSIQVIVRAEAYSCPLCII